jgi:hypothetical protein
VAAVAESVGDKLSDSRDFVGVGVDGDTSADPRLLLDLGEAEGEEGGVRVSSFEASSRGSSLGFLAVYLSSATITC